MNTNKTQHTERLVRLFGITSGEAEEALVRADGNLTRAYVALREKSQRSVVFIAGAVLGDDGVLVKVRLRTKQSGPRLPEPDAVNKSVLDGIGGEVTTEGDEREAISARLTADFPDFTNEILDYSMVSAPNVHLALHRKSGRAMYDTGVLLVTSASADARFAKQLGLHIAFFAPLSIHPQPFPGAIDHHEPHTRRTALLNAPYEFDDLHPDGSAGDTSNTIGGVAAERGIEIVGFVRMSASAPTITATS